MPERDTSRQVDPDAQRAQRRAVWPLKRPATHTGIALGKPPGSSLLALSMGCMKPATTVIKWRGQLSARPPSRRPKESAGQWNRRRARATSASRHVLMQNDPTSSTRRPRRSTSRCPRKIRASQDSRGLPVGGWGWISCHVRGCRLSWLVRSGRSANRSRCATGIGHRCGGD